MKNTTPRGFVYLIQVDGSERVKIGFSLSPETRLKQLQTGSPFPLSLVGQWPGTPADERRIHRLFADCRSHLEWFLAPAEIVSRVISEYFINVQPSESPRSNKRRYGSKVPVPPGKYIYWSKVGNGLKLEQRRPSYRYIGFMMPHHVKYLQQRYGKQGMAVEINRIIAAMRIIEFASTKSSSSLPYSPIVE
jgi:Meiotically up-regulated gene 113